MTKLNATSTASWFDFAASLGIVSSWLPLRTLACLGRVIVVCVGGWLLEASAEAERAPSSGEERRLPLLLPRV